MDLQQNIAAYLHYCENQKKLDQKTIKAYRIDLQHFALEVAGQDSFSKPALVHYIESLHNHYRPRSAKRKIASIKAFTNYLVFEDILEHSPFAKVNTKFQEPSKLPRTIPLQIIENILRLAYHRKGAFPIESSQHLSALRDIAVLELLFATGVRVSELCGLHDCDINLQEGFVLILGKGSRERIVQLENLAVLQALATYRKAFANEINSANYFFVNRLHKRLSEQSVRNMIHHYTSLIFPQPYVTPHMYRHSVATLLLEADVDTRYIQNLLGHSSISTTQIYTHVAAKKQRDILSTKHPRNNICL